MRSIAALALGFALLLVSDGPSHAEFLLNCRLMDHYNPVYERYCQGENGNLYLVAKECPEGDVCIVKKQNFKGAYSAGGNVVDSAVSEVARAAEEAGPETGLAAINASRADQSTP